MMLDAANFSYNHDSWEEFVTLGKVKFLDVTFRSAAENLACDEALLDWCEEACSDNEVLRIWEPKEFFIVLGYANRAAAEVNLQACRDRGIPVFRRCSGGGAVLQGPGCLNYSLILKTDRPDFSRNITETNCSIMKRNAAVVSRLTGEAVEVQGVTDLAIRDRKFSGNSQRRKKKFLLFHGAFLVNLDIKLISELLELPSQQPNYRRNRSHAEFLTRLNISIDALKAGLQQTWDAFEPLIEVPQNLIQRLVEEKYSNEQWNRKW